MIDIFTHIRAWDSSEETDISLLQKKNGYYTRELLKGSKLSLTTQARKHLQGRETHHQNDTWTNLQGELR